MKYLYGPVISRRLGRSLGINIVPFKTCTYSCVYCQLGPTTNKTVKRTSYFDRESVIDEIRKIRKWNFDYFTFSGEGEPTLNKDIGIFIKEAKDVGARIAVLTNGSLLWMEEVRSDLKNADIVIPSLDAATPEIFRKINRPHRSLEIDKIIEGLINFREEYDGLFYIEIMLVKGYNTSESELVKIKEALDLIKPRGVYLLIPTRPPVEKIDIPSYLDIIKAETIIGSSIRVTLPEFGVFDLIDPSKPKKSILSIIKRHPLREDQIKSIIKEYKLKLELSEIEKETRIVFFKGIKYYIYNKRS